MGFFDSLFGTTDSSEDSDKYLKEIPGMIKPYYDPYINAGNKAINPLQEQYSNLMNDPTQKYNQIAGGYNHSPGFDFSMKQALGAANNAAAAGGMAGSPQHQQQAMEMATGLSNQDFGNYMQNALGMYGQGLNGMENTVNRGYGASNEYANSVAQNQMNRANLSYAGQNNQNQQKGGMWGNVLGFAGNAAKNFIPGASFFTGDDPEYGRKSSNGMWGVG